MSARSRRRRAQRDTIDIPSDPLVTLLRPISPSPVVSESSRFSLREVDDGRVWHPEVGPRAVTVGGSAARVGFPASKGRAGLAASSQAAFSTPGGNLAPRVAVRVSPGRSIGFEAPGNVVVCVRRKVRREVLFAERRTRRGAGSRRHRNWLSDIRC